MSHLQQSLQSSSVAETLATYESWAASYNDDVASEGYVAPALAGDYLAHHLGGAAGLASAAILDAGCGTGLVGQHLARLGGARRIDGVDLSPAMLAAARRTGTYASLTVADLSKPLEMVADASYDALTCVGTLTRGHVGAHALDEMVRVVRPGGVLVVTVRDAVWREGGYEEKVKDGIAQSKTRLMTDNFEVRRVAKDVDLVYVVLQVL